MSLLSIIASKKKNFNLQKPKPGFIFWLIAFSLLGIVLGTLTFYSLNK